MHVMTYASGLPIMYPLGFMHFTFVYWLYKILFTKFYRKTGTFDDILASRTVWYLKVGVMMHLLMGAFVYSNSNILSEGNLRFLSGIKDQAMSQSGVPDSAANKPKSLEDI